LSSDFKATLKQSIKQSMYLQLHKRKIHSIILHAMTNKEFNLKYGKDSIKVSIPEKDIIAVLETKKMDKLSHPRACVVDAIKEPIGAQPIPQIVKAKEKVVIVCSDRTRTAKMDIVLPVVINELHESGIEYKDITILFATGTHRLHTPEEQKKIIGPFVPGEVKLLDHDAKDDANLALIGTTSRGNKIKINKLALDTDRVILCGGITYHYFAGFGGGRKSVLPGISGFDTIQFNHKLLMGKEPGSEMNPNCITAKLEGNPIHEDMVEAAKMLGPDFIVNTILNEDRELAKVVAGDLEKAHLEGCKYIDKYAKVKIQNKADLVIASSGGGTMDLNFVQSHKAMENASYALRDRGVMILIAETAEGLPTDEYMQWIEMGSSKAIEDGLRKNFSIPGHTVYAAIHKGERFKVIWVTKMDKEIVKKMGMIPVDSPEEALSKAYDILGDKRSTYVMPHAYTTLPAKE